MAAARAVSPRRCRHRVLTGSPPGTRTGTGRQLTEQLTGIRGDEEEEVADEPHLVTDEGLVHLVDRLRSQPVTSTTSHMKKASTYRPRPTIRTAMLAGIARITRKSTAAAAQPGGRWDGELDVILRRLADAEGREAIAEQEQIGLEPELHPQVDGHDGAHEVGRTTRHERGEPTEHHTDAGRKADHEDHHGEGDGQNGDGAARLHRRCLARSGSIASSGSGSAGGTSSPG